jgi:aspartate/methionine/tyrosine aminotransferase
MEDLREHPRETPTRRGVRFSTGEMSALVDEHVRYDLGESTCPPLRLDQVIDPPALGELLVDYGTSRGAEDLRAFIAADAGVETEQVMTTSGAAEAMFLLAQDRCHGRTLMVTPCFPTARAVPEGLGSPVDTVRLSFDDGYRLRHDAVADALTAETTLVSVASPQNPSGVTLTAHELADLVDVVAERAPQAVVLVDETYRASTYGQAAAPRSAASLAPGVVTCSSLSKAHGAPGLRVGWLTTTDDELMERLRNAKFLTSVSRSTLDEALGVRVLRSSDEILGVRADRLARALTELEQWTRGQPVDFVRPDGGALCCLRLSRDRFPDEAGVSAFYAGLASRELRVAPGSWFGDEERVFRVGFGHLEPALFTEALGRLAELLGSVGR